MTRTVRRLVGAIVALAALPALARGEYLAMTTCNECHGLDLRGTIFPEGVTPDLVIASAYPEEDFRRLLTLSNQPVPPNVRWRRLEAVSD